MTVALGKLKDFFSNKTVRIVLVAVLALLLLFAVYKVFFGGGTGGYEESEQEKRLSRLLNKVDGVKDTTVMITEKGGEAVGVVVVFEGNDGLLTRMQLSRIAASALNIGQNAVVVYAAKG